MAGDPPRPRRTQIDFAPAVVRSRRGAALERLIEWTAPARDAARPRDRAAGPKRRPAATRRARGRPPIADVYREAVGRDAAEPTCQRASSADRRSRWSGGGRSRSSPRRRGPAPAPPSQEEMQRRLEEQLRQVRVQDLLLESVVEHPQPLRRAGSRKADERDLEQARIGIEAVRAVVDLLEPGPREQVREALSQVQMLYARESGGEGARRGAGSRRRRRAASPAKGRRRRGRGPPASRRRGCGRRPAPS